MTVDIIGNFDRAAEKYDACAGPQAALAAELAGWIAPGERRGCAREFGAGTGLLTRRLLPWTGVYVATDAAPAMVRLGRARCPEAQWEQGDARAPVAEKVDWVFAGNVLQWLEEPGAVLRRWREALAPGGQIALSVLARGTLGELESLLPEAPPLRWRTAAEWAELAEGAGFILERVEEWDTLSVYPSAGKFLRTLHAAGLAPRRAVGAGRLRAALRAYDERFAVPGGVRATWRAWLARGRAG